MTGLRTRVCLAWIFGILLMPVWGATPPIIEVDGGSVSGVSLSGNAGLAVYRGIPYAAPPVGAFRWQPPRRVQPWSDIRACTTFGAAAPQPSNHPTQRFSEDCLYLNVWTPRAGEPAAKLPVMVWIHGGGLNRSWAHKEFYDGAGLAERGVVLVSLNYRLGALGFLAHPGLSAESAHGVSGNYGFLDQIAALRWVRRHIAGFGGDPDRVTIFGESAGGTSVAVLCASPLARGLFQRAILQSPWMFGFINKLAEPNMVRLRDPVASTPSAEALGQQWASRFTVGLPPAAAVDKLRSLTPEQLREGLSYYRTRATIDGWLLPAHPAEVFAAGQQAPVPMLIGTTRDEGAYFTNWVSFSGRSEFLGALNDFYGPAAGAVAACYPGTDATTLRQAGTQFVTDAWFVHPARQLLQGAAASRAAVFHYEFAQPSAQSTDGRVPHAAELRYVFQTLLEGATEEDRQVADRMAGLWVQFARTGNPNRADLPDWPVYTRGERPYLKIRAGFGVGTHLGGSVMDGLDRATRSIYSGR